MPLPVLIDVISRYYSAQTFLKVGLVILAIVVSRAYAQGRSTTRERDLHGRIVLLTGAFSTLGSTLLEGLAQRGAHIIALTPLPIEAPEIALVIEALRETTKNENIFAEQCDLLSIESTRAFCTKFLTGKEHRLDAIVFTHEYEHVGPLFASKEEKLACEERRSAASVSTFLMMTLLLPALLVAPAERDIRIINVVNPFYAAAVLQFPTPPSIEGSQFLREGYRALRNVVLTRHLQRVLDALPHAPAPNPDSAAAPAASSKVQKSNIVAVSVSPGFSRRDTVAPLLRAKLRSSEFSLVGFVVYILLQPLLHIFAKSPSHAEQTVLHALFLPTPFKFASLPAEQERTDTGPAEEALKPGALYSDCAVVGIDMRHRVQPTQSDDKKDDSFSGTSMVDDGEYGGEELGRVVWESFEVDLKAREKKPATSSSHASTDKKSE